MVSARIPVRFEETAQHTNRMEGVAYQPSTCQEPLFPIIDTHVPHTISARILHPRTYELSLCAINHRTRGFKIDNSDISADTDTDDPISTGNPPRLSLFFPLSVYFRI